MTMVWTKVTMILGMNKYMIRKQFKIDISILREDLKDIVYNQYIRNCGKYLNHKMIKQIDNDLGYLDIVIEEIDNTDLLGQYRELYNEYVENLKQYC